MSADGIKKGDLVWVYGLRGSSTEDCLGLVQRELSLAPNGAQVFEILVNSLIYNIIDWRIQPVVEEGLRDQALDAADDMND